MVNPSDLLLTLIRYGNIAHDYLCNHLSNKDISEYLDFLNNATITHGEAFRLITKEHGHTETVFYALESLSRINAMCNTAECPSETPVDPERAFIVAFSALQAGMLIGAIADDKGKEAIITLAEHGKKFALNAGRSDDEFTHYLVKLFQDFYQGRSRYPRNKEVIAVLEKAQRQGFIHTIDDTTVEWGEKGSTRITTLEKDRLPRIRKKLRVSDKP